MSDEKLGEFFKQSGEISRHSLDLLLEIDILEMSLQYKLELLRLAD